MKCPNCEYPRLKYLEQRKEGKKEKGRENFKAECPKCDWKGELK